MSLIPTSIISILFLGGACVASDNNPSVPEYIEAPTSEKSSYPDATNSPVSGLVTNVIDAITIEVTTENGSHIVSYLGLSPPLPQQLSGQESKFSEEAESFNAYLTLGNIVDLESDPSIHDNSKILSRYVYHNGQSINKLLLERGLARLSEDVTDYELKSEFALAQQTALSAERGIWIVDKKQEVTSSTSIESPQKVESGDIFIGGTLPSRELIDRKPKCEFSGTTVPLIKGILDRNTGELIYYLPSDYKYDGLVVNKSFGDIWLCTEKEAQNQGWGKAYR